MYNIHRTSPMIASSNVRETLAFFTTALGFTVIADFGGYIVISKNNFAVHLKQFPAEISPAEFYLEVDNVDTFWESILPHVSGLRTRAPFDREYGMREAHIEPPHTKTILYVGQQLSR